MSKYVFGVDLGGTTVKIGLFDTEGNKLDTWEIVTRTENGGENILPDIAASVKAKIEEKGLCKDEIVGVGIGVPGPVDAQGIVHKCVNLGWGVFNISEKLSELTGLRAEAGNDANVAALGECWMGSGKGSQDMVLLTLGTGVGGGIISGGKLLTGANGAGGEVGHFHLVYGETEPCGCGHYGCFEEYASATGVVRIGRRVLAACETPSPLRDITLTSKDIFAYAAQGDEVAMEITKQYGYYLGLGCSVVASILNPEVIVLGGGVSKAGQTLIDLLMPSFMESAFHACSHCRFEIASLGNDAGIYGAAKLLL